MPKEAALDPADCQQDDLKRAQADLHSFWGSSPENAMTVWKSWSFEWLLIVPLPTSSINWATLGHPCKRGITLVFFNWFQLSFQLIKRKAKAPKTSFFLNPSKQQYQLLLSVNRTEVLCILALDLPRGVCQERRLQLLHLVRKNMILFHLISIWNLIWTTSGTTETEHSPTPATSTPRVIRWINEYSIHWIPSKFIAVSCDQEEEDCQHCYSGPGMSYAMVYCCWNILLLLLSLLSLLILFCYCCRFATLDQICLKQGCWLMWLKICAHMKNKPHYCTAKLSQGDIISSVWQFFITMIRSWANYTRRVQEKILGQ